MCYNTKTKSFSPNNTWPKRVEQAQVSRAFRCPAWWPGGRLTPGEYKDVGMAIGRMECLSTHNRNPNPTRTLIRIKIHPRNRNPIGYLKPALVWQYSKSNKYFLQTYT